VTGKIGVAAGLALEGIRSVRASIDRFLALNDR
jgi:hypothetical protein